MAGSALAAGTAAAQNRYVYFPSADVKDGHFLSIAGAGFQTLAGDITMKIASPATATSVEIGIFDGETSGMWDYGNVVLTYTLYADPAGNGTGTDQIAQWSGNSMPDNGWFNATITNIATARGLDGDYFYMLKISTPNASASYLSVFKVRTNGTVAVTANQSFAYIAPLNSLADAQTIYPAYPTLTPTTYDGAWNFFLDIQKPQGRLEVWDGDMDYGKYDCSDNDSDDADTPNELPGFAVGSAAVAEGIGGGGVPCMNASGVVTSGYTTSNPPDDSQRPTSQRSPNVSYEIIDPSGVHYANTNPSGNVEWERFVIDTSAMNRSEMDYHAESLPAGVYQIRIAGVDMSNLNAWRFPYDALGVDSTGAAVLPIRLDFNDGAVDGTVYYDANASGVQDPGEPGIPVVSVSLEADYDKNGAVDQTFSVESDENGHYHFGSLKGGRYKVKVDMTSLADDVVPTADPDGLATPNQTTFDLTMTQRTNVSPFGYKRTSPPGTRTRGYWVNHTENWPLNYITLGCITYTKAQAIAILQRPTKGDNTYSMAAQLIAAKLNLADGNNSSCIASTVDSADTWLCDNPVGSGGKQAWGVGQPIHNQLDDYNNGRLCAPHMN